MRQFGLIGYPLSHSFSQHYFTEKFRKEGITNCIYNNFPIPSIADLDQLLLDHPGLQGLNVTIPYKQLVIPRLDDRSSLPLDACNCIRIIDGRLIGYNTDVTGFRQTLQSGLKPYHQKALVLGKGGASAAVEYVLRNLGIVTTIVSRRAKDGDGITYEDLTSDLMAENLLIVNTTPLGMYPKVDECPEIPYHLLTPRHYLFDLIYNPKQTLFLQKAVMQGAYIKNGEEMLVIQAEESWTIWNS